MKRFFGIFALVAAAVVGAPFAAHSNPGNPVGAAALPALSALDEKAVQKVIAAQLAAFAQDDAVKAFSYAAPSIRQAMQGDADAFIAMVRRSYPAVYRPASVVYLKPERLQASASGAEQVVQRVQIQDADGKAWVAVYGLERARKPKNSPWRINGCLLTPSQGRMA